MTSDDRDEDTDAERPGIVRTVLSGLFETIADMDERGQQRRSATGSGRSGTTRFDYGVDIGIGPGREADESRDPAVESDREYAAAVSPTDEGCVVTLDLPDVDPTELAAGVDSSGGTLVVGAGSTILERVSLPRNDLEVADASFNNGVLDVRLVAEDAG